MKLRNILYVLIVSCAAFPTASFSAAASESADLIIYDAKVLTVDSKFSVDKAIAIQGDKIIAVGNGKLEKYQGPQTRLIDAKGRTVLPGLYDSQVCSFKAATSELEASQPALDSIAAAQDYIRQQATNQPHGSWIILRWLYPTRLKEGRPPTRAELDAATTNNPVYWDCGPLAVVNSKALEVSKISKGIQAPPGGEILLDPKTLKPNGMLRNAASLLKIPPPAHPPTKQQVRDAVKHLHQLYNEQGITSISESWSSPESIDLFRDLSQAGELTVRVNCARPLDRAGNTVEEGVAQLDVMTNSKAGKLSYGPTGVGDDWVRMGPLKLVLDGDVSVGTAYLRTPWGIGPTYQNTEPAYQGEIHCDPDILIGLLQEAAQRGWQLAGHCAGDAAADNLLRIYQTIHFKQNILQRRFLITHVNFQADQNWEKCQKLGVAAAIQPVWLFKDGASLMKTLGARRMKNFLPLKTWEDKGLIIGGGSDHLGKLDSLEASNPWNPWLGMWVALTRQTEQGVMINPEEKLTREQVIRLYTRNNCYLNFEETKKGSLEPGKYADLIMVDIDLLKCPVDDIRYTKVALTMIGGKVVWDAENR